MSIEPEIAATVDRVLAAEIIAPLWSDYRRCPICRAEPGQACRAMYSTVRDGRPDGPPQPLNIAHGFRERRRGR